MVLKKSIKMNHFQITKLLRQNHKIFQKLFILLNLSAQDLSNDIIIIKIELVKPIINSPDSVRPKWFRIYF